MSEAIHAEIIQLAKLMNNGLIDAEGVNRLESLIHQEARYRQWYVEFLDLNAELIRRSSQIDPSEMIENVLVHHPWYQQPAARNVAIGALSLVTVLSLFLAFWLIPRPLPRIQATLVLTSDQTVWSHTDLSAGHVFRQRDWIELEQGTARLLTNGGVQVDLIAPVRLQFLGDDFLHLPTGVVHSRVPEGVNGYQIQTPDALIIDLGTEFTVKRHQEQGTMVYVDSGVVEVSSLNQSGNIINTRQMTTGQSAQYITSQAVRAIEPSLLLSPELQRLKQTGSGIRRTDGDLRISTVELKVLTDDVQLTDGYLLVVPEKHEVQLTAPLTIETRFGQQSLGTDQTYDSFLIHYRPNETVPMGAQGSITFHQAIAAVVDQTGALKKTDPLFAAADVVWSDDEFRSFEQDDILQLSEDRKTLTIHPGISGSRYLDQLRILVPHAP